MDLLGKSTWVRGKQFGGSTQYIAAFVQQRQQHIDTQHACMPDLANTESEVHTVCQPSLH